MYYKQKDLRKAPIFIEDEGMVFDGKESFDFSKGVIHFQAGQNMVLDGNRVIELHDTRRSKLFMAYRRLINNIWWPL